ncbi:hypothetical protein E1301_Tti016059 [Triplophysa tibetana]|uniref:Uncharacterized protein n=1 Tax=Triplophysa tibetana TaxID=1572043 RepID=A0A5A9P2D4_9TELE|nr:hypothetical protein E1301_Tti016059 [Triplophysa tibetana]
MPKSAYMVDEGQVDAKAARMHDKPRMAVAMETEGTNQYCQSATLCQGLDWAQRVLRSLPRILLSRHWQAEGNRIKIS